MLKIVLLIVPLSLFSMSVNQVNEVSKSGLGCIKGVGDKRFQRIIEYKKSHSIKAIDDLLNIKGVGKGVIKNIREDVIKKSCKRESHKSNKSKRGHPRKKTNAK